METQTRLSRHNKFISAENVGSTYVSYINLLKKRNGFLEILQKHISFWILLFQPL